MVHLPSTRSPLRGHVEHSVSLEGAGKRRPDPDSSALELPLPGDCFFLPLGPPPFSSPALCFPVAPARLPNGSQISLALSLQGVCVCH